MEKNRKINKRGEGGSSGTCEKAGFHAMSKSALAEARDFISYKENTYANTKARTATIMAAERGQGQITPGPQGPKGLIKPNATRPGGPRMENQQ